jgi:type VI secretion system protein VasG
MIELRRDKLFGKLNQIAYQTMEGATLFCKMRGNPYVELVHWIHQLFEHPGSDFRRLAEAFELDPARLSADLTRALDQLPRGSTSVQDLSPQLDRVVERAWTYASLMFNETRVRSGHVLLAALTTPELALQVRGISRQFERISADELARRFESVLANGAESKLVVSAASEQTGATVADSDAPSTLFPTLRLYAVDLTERARKGELDPVIGREQEIRRVVDILLRRRQNNPILTGEAGVGKTAVVEGLALRIARGEVPAALRNVSLFALDLGSLHAGASMRGEFEQRLRQVVEEVQGAPHPVILFIDEAHTLIGAGGAAGTGDAANLLKPALARGTLRTIAATTWAEYKRHIEKDAALVRRFQVVQVQEPDEDTALRMLRSMAASLERHHAVPVLDDAVEAAVKLSLRYIPARQLPDKGVALLDTACARVAVSQHGVPPAIEDCRSMIESLEIELAILRREGELGAGTAPRIEKAQTRREQASKRLHELELQWEMERSLVARLLALRETLRSDRSPDARIERKAEHARLLEELSRVQGDAPLILPLVDANAVSVVVSDWTGVPVGRMVRDEIQAVLRLSETLGRRVLGQQHALELIATRIQTTRAGLEDPRKPIGVFLLAGPSGVGKTETAIALAEALFGSEQSLITINMSEFQEAHTVSTLKGAPPGYVGYGEGGVLTEAVRRRPYSVILLDEVEKAHPDVHELFFQVFDKGVMEDGEGRSVDFKNTLILLTTNAGSELIAQACESGERPSPEALTDALRGPLLQVFPPALLGRMVPVPYYSLSDELLRSIARMQLERIRARVEARYEVPLRFRDEVVDFVVERCHQTDAGARVVESLLSNLLLPALSHHFLGRLASGTALEGVAVAVVDDRITVTNF